MDCSPVALTLQTIRLVQHFNDVDFVTFKKSVLAEFDCKNEKEFLKKVLIFSQSHLPTQTTRNIYNSALDISKSKSNSKSKPKEKKNAFSSLPSSVIQSIGSYLTVDASLILSYSNHHLHIETQNPTFILNRRSDMDEFVTIDRKSIKILQDKNGNMISYPYHFPYSVDFGGIIKSVNEAFDNYDDSICQTDINVVEQDSNKINGQNVQEIVSSNLYLQNILKYVQYIKILPSWSHAIRVNQLFDNNKFKQQLDIFFPIVDTPVLEPFLKQCKKYYNGSMKMIDNLIIENVGSREINPIRTDHPGGIILQKPAKSRTGRMSTSRAIGHRHGEYANKFFGSLNENFKKLHIYSDIVSIDNFQCLSSIFHRNLESLTLGYPTINYILNKEFLQAQIEFDIDIKSKQKIIVPQKFQYLSVCLYSFDDVDTHLWMNKFWKSMNKLSMFTYLKTLSLQFDETQTIHQCLNYKNGWLTNELKNKNKNSSGIPNLSHIIIGIKNDFYGSERESSRYHRALRLSSFTTDNEYMGQRFFMTSSVFKHFSDICQNGLFKNTKNNVAHLSKVTLKWFFQCDSDCFIDKLNGKQTNGRTTFVKCNTINQDGVEERHQHKCTYYNGYVVHINSSVNNSIIQSHFKPICQWIVESITSNSEQSTADFEVDFACIK